MTKFRSVYRPLPFLRIAVVVGAVFLLAAPSLRAADKVPLQINAYTIDAELKPQSHMLTAVTRVTFTALEPVETAVFELHGALKVDKVTDSRNQPLSGERGAEASLRITPQQPLTKGQTYYLDLLLLRSPGKRCRRSRRRPKTHLYRRSHRYLFYAGRWFPMTGYLTNRFTADMQSAFPPDTRVIGSGSKAALNSAARARSRTSTGTSPASPERSLPANSTLSVSAARNIQVYTTAAHKGPLPITPRSRCINSHTSPRPSACPSRATLNIVELPNDTVPCHWAPEIAAVAGNASAKKPTDACSQTPSRTSGGAAR